MYRRRCGLCVHTLWAESWFDGRPVRDLVDEIEDAFLGGDIARSIRGIVCCRNDALELVVRLFQPTPTTVSASPLSRQVGQGNGNDARG